jgi:hypothetical protein
MKTDEKDFETLLTIIHIHHQASIEYSAGALDGSCV